MTESGLIMKKSKLLPLLLAFLMLGLLSSSAVASIFWPHWGRRDNSSQHFCKQHHSVQPKAIHPKTPKNRRHAGPRA